VEGHVDPTPAAARVRPSLGIGSRTPTGRRRFYASRGLENSSACATPRQGAAPVATLCRSLSSLSGDHRTLLEGR
jgi:hypothetical protein